MSEKCTNCGHDVTALNSFGVCASGEGCLRRQLSQAVEAKEKMERRAECAEQKCHNLEGEKQQLNDAALDIIAKMTEAQVETYERAESLRRQLAQAAEGRKREEERAGRATDAMLVAEQRERRAKVENERLRAALARIAEWPYDIMGDCVAQAKAEAALAAKEKADGNK
ncbi:MAG: hypothetical protein IMZ69_03620 [Spirochaetes bacterium]|nr:hypothetical protein [Spirochaetota bacterium]